VRILACVALTGVLLAVAVPAVAGEVKVTFANGLVTIVATDASPRQILGEWAKLGQVRITNLERLTGGPVTIQITNAPEAQALETLLRGTAGYVAAPRASAGDMAALSRYDRILLMPGVAPAVVPVAPAPTTVSRGRPAALPAFDDQDDDQPEAQPRAMPTTPGMPQRFGGGGTVPGRSATPGQTLAPGQSASPGQFVPQRSPYQQQASPYGGATPPTTQQASPAGSRQIAPSQNPQLPPGATGSSVPGMTTAPIQLPTTPYSNSGPPAMVVQPDDVQSPVSAARPGEATAPTPEMYRNPYGLAEPIRPPVTNPSANPYGLVNPVKTAVAPTTPGAATPGATTPGTTTPGATTPPGPIKKGPGGEG
jgi:hypothetical protein